MSRNFDKRLNSKDVVGIITPMIEALLKREAGSIVIKKNVKNLHIEEVDKVNLTLS